MFSDFGSFFDLIGNDVLALGSAVVQIVSDLFSSGSYGGGGGFGGQYPLG